MICRPLFVTPEENGNKLANCLFIVEKKIAQNKSNIYGRCIFLA
jgi:hypothetical protein